MNPAFLGEESQLLKKAGAWHTATEIAQQPALWKQIFRLIYAEKDRICQFFEMALADPTTDIVLTGAGSSAFIGKILEGPFSKCTGRTARAVATTDILTHPENYICKKRALLLVSFARSGNSPESSAVVALVSSLCSSVHHLVITCNPDGQLANGTLKEEQELVILLPEETDDKSLVMTSSFSCMLLAGVLVARIKQIDELAQQVNILAKYGELIIDHYSASLKIVAEMDFDRVIFLGSGPLLGVAEESQLKVQELTDGKVVGKHDSYLGFRHGPKAVINSRTLIVFLFSNQQYVFGYESDLVQDVNSKEKGMYRLGVIESGGENLSLDLLLRMTDGCPQIEEELTAICSVLPAQILGLFASIKLGLQPDNPSRNGAITRIVQGVNIYPFIRS